MAGVSPRDMDGLEAVLGPGAMASALRVDGHTRLSPPLTSSTCAMRSTWIVARARSAGSATAKECS